MALVSVIWIPRSDLPESKVLYFCKLDIYCQVCLLRSLIHFHSRGGHMWVSTHPWLADVIKHLYFGQCDRWKQYFMHLNHISYLMNQASCQIRLCDRISFSINHQFMSPIHVLFGWLLFLSVFYWFCYYRCPIFFLPFIPLLPGPRLPPALPP